ncbi:MAG: hypothetical protein KIS79_02240 [Burkholderiales bacterium]|nr:hypothetical protein [Burkholderiales bacterium]
MDRNVIVDTSVILDGIVIVDAIFIDYAMVDCRYKRRRALGVIPLSGIFLSSRAKGEGSCFSNRWCEDSSLRSE